MTIAQGGAALAIDLGTGGLKVGIFDRGGRLVRSATAEVPSAYGPGGTATQDAEGWWKAVVSMAASLTQQTGLGPEVRAIACTGQWASTVPVDADGNVVGECLLWMDTRGGALSAARIGGRAAGYNAARALRFIRKSGGAPSRYGADPIGHILYLEAEEPGVASKARWYLEPVDFLTMRITGKVTATAASMTAAWLTDNRVPGALEYDAELIGLAGIPAAKLPPLVPAGSMVGTIRPEVAVAMGISGEARVVTGLPDLHTAVIGSGATRIGEVHLCLSTTSWISAPVARKKTDVLHSVATVPGIAAGEYFIADNHETAGECLDWLRSSLVAPGDMLGPGGFSPSFAELDQLAATAVPGCGGVIFTPWLAGERSPVDDRNARAGFLGISLATTRAEMVRSVLEGVAYSNRWLYESVRRFLRAEPTSLRILGGGATSDLWCQIHADVLDLTVERVEEPIFANLRGAALVAMVGTGMIGAEVARRAVEVGKTFVPNASLSRVYTANYRVFSKIYSRQKPLFAALESARKAAG